MSFLYRKCASVLENVLNHKGTVRSLALSGNGPSTEKQMVYAVVSKTMKSMWSVGHAVHAHYTEKNILESVIRDSGLADKHPDWSRGMVMVMLYDVLYSKGGGRGGGVILRELNKMKPKLEVLRDSMEQLHEDSTVVVVHPKYARVNTLFSSNVDAMEYVRTHLNTQPKVVVDRHVKVQVKPWNVLEYRMDDVIPNLLVFDSRVDLHNHECVVNGSLLLQDKSSCFPPWAMDIQAGDVVIDACSAPGMKTTLLASRVTAAGHVYAVERDTTRAKLLKNNLERCGAGDVVDVVVADFLTLNPNDYRDVTSIMADPSCSGSGTPDAALFPSVQQVVYSTCSINEEENEGVVKRVLERNPEFQLAPPSTPIDRWHRRGHSVLLDAEQEWTRPLMVASVSSWPGSSGGSRAHADSILMVKAYITVTDDV